MKLVLAVTASFLLAIAAASAQPGPADAAQAPPSRCPQFPPEPVVPDGATATRDELLQANEAFQAWRPQMHAVLECLRPEADEARLAYEAAQVSLTELETVRGAAAAAFEAAPARRREEPWEEFQEAQERVEAQEAIVRDALARYQARAGAFNAGVGRLNAVDAAVQAEITEFNESHGRS